MATKTIAGMVICDSNSVIRFGVYSRSMRVIGSGSIAAGETTPLSNDTLNLELTYYNSHTDIKPMPFYVFTSMRLVQSGGSSATEGYYIVTPRIKIVGSSGSYSGLSMSYPSVTGETVGYYLEGDFVYGFS